jgi:hypothetical protein
MTTQARPIAASHGVTLLMDGIRVRDEGTYNVMEAARQAILAVGQGVQERVMYGGLMFSANNEPFCGVFAYAKHVSIEFSNGATLPDTYRQLEGSGKMRRHIKLRAASEIDTKFVAEYVAEAFDRTQLARGR